MVKQQHKNIYNKIYKSKTVKPMIQSRLHKNFKAALNNAHKNKQFYWQAQLLLPFKSLTIVRKITFSVV